MTNDTISDLLCRIRNALLARHNFVNVSNTATTEALCKIFQKEGFIHRYTVDQRNSQNIIISLKYGHNRPAIQHCYRISKPSLRIYSKHKNLSRLLKRLQKKSKKK